MPAPAPAAEPADPHHCTVGPGLLELFADVPDPRDPRGLIHPLPTVLALAACAVVAGQSTLQAVTEWARDLTEAEYLALGVRYDLLRGAFIVPSLATLERVLAALAAEPLERAATAWVCARMPEGPELRAIAVDGKSLRGSADYDEPLVHLVAALDTAHQTVLAQQRVAAKSNEIPAFTEVLAHIGPALLAGAVVTADAMHCQRASARFLHGAGAYYVFYAAGNQPGLFAAINTLDWQNTPVGHRSRDCGHGRREVRTIQVRPAPAGLPFPHAQQVFLLERYTLGRGGAIASASAVLGVTSLPASVAGPERIMGCCRGQWQIENPLHWVRDVVFNEDRHRLRKGGAPQAMACLRNLAISALRLSGGGEIASASRWNHRRSRRPLQTLGIVD